MQLRLGTSSLNLREMLDHFYEDAEDRHDKEEQVTLLGERQGELEEQLAAVEDALRELGCYENSDGIFAPTPVSRQPQSGIQINNKLSFRGIQKSLEYFDRLDEDNDGFLTFEDFRAMRSNAKHVGIVHEHHYRHW